MNEEILDEINEIIELFGNKIKKYKEDWVYYPNSKPIKKNGY